MLQIGRRGLLLGLGASLLLPKPAIIRTPGLLMKVHQAPGEFEQMNQMSPSGPGPGVPSSMWGAGLLRDKGWTTWMGHDGATWASHPGGFTRRYGGRLVKPNRTMATPYALESGLVTAAQDQDISDLSPAYIAAAEKGEDFWGVDWDAVDAAAAEALGPPTATPGGMVTLKPLKAIS